MGDTEQRQHDESPYGDSEFMTYELWTMNDESRVMNAWYLILARYSSRENLAERIYNLKRCQPETGCSVRFKTGGHKDSDPESVDLQSVNDSSIPIPIPAQYIVPFGNWLILGL